MPERETSSWAGYSERTKSAVASTSFQSIKPSIKKFRNELQHKAHDKQLSVITDRFTYTPLPRPSCTRLLTIDPGSPSDVISCSLRIVDLNDRPEYTALSYTWDLGPSWRSTIKKWYPIVKGMWVDEPPTEMAGDSKDEGGSSGTADEKKDKSNGEIKKKIICNYQVFEVQPNLYDALLHLRQARPGTYWIDAICTDQTNKDELAIQVPRMNEIYNCASLTVVWLGTCPSPMSPGIRRFLAWARSHSSHEQREKEPLFQNDPSAALSVVCLVSRRWFRRLWVVQEMCLPRNLSFLFGDHALTEGDLTAALDALKSALHDTRTSESGGSMGLVMDHATHIGMRFWGQHLRWLPANIELRQLYQSGLANSGRPQLWTLDQWLLATKGRKARDPRDLVYGGMALIRPEDLRIRQTIQLSEDEEAALNIGFQGRNANHTTTKLWPEINVDYRAPVPTVLINLAACALSNNEQSDRHGVISLLSIASRARDLGNEDEYYDPLTKKDIIDNPLPSWVPNPGSPASAIDTLASLGGTGFRACLPPPPPPPRPPRHGHHHHQEGQNSQLVERKQRSGGDGPRISADGTKLYVEAVRLGTIEGPNWGAIGMPDADYELEELDDVDWETKRAAVIVVRGMADLFLSDLEWDYRLPRGFLQFLFDLPTVYEPAGGSTFEAMARVMTGGVATRRPERLGATPPMMTSDDLRKGLCGMIESYMESLEKGTKDGRERGEINRQNNKRKQQSRRFFPGSKKKSEREGRAMEREAQEAEMFLISERELYKNLKEKFPEENWRQQPLPEGKDNRPEEWKKIQRDFEVAYTRAMTGRCLQKVREEDGGYLVLVPTWVKKGDVVMLVRGCYVPYVFTPYELHVERKTESLKDLQEAMKSEQWRRELSAFEIEKWKIRLSAPKRDLVTKAGGYILAGEAYVDGVMHGEAAEIGEAWFERVVIV